MKALGMIEVYSFTTAVVATDLCAKAADVKVIAFDRNRPKSADAPAPLVMQIKITGNVAAVKAAVEAGTEKWLIFSISTEINITKSSQRTL